MFGPALGVASALDREIMSRRSHLLPLTVLTSLCVGTLDVARGDRAGSDEALAVFAGGSIRVADMEVSLAQKLPETRRHLATSDGRKQYLDALVRYDLLVLEAERRKYGQHPVVVEATRQAAIDAWLAHEEAAAPVASSDAEVAQYYDAHVDQFQPARLRRASQIFVASEPAARALITQLGRATPEEFARMATSMSQDPRSARQGGELGFFDATGKPADATRPPVPAALAAAVFALGDGGPARVGRSRADREPPQLLMRPVPVPGGFNVVMWTGEKSRPSASLAEASDGIRAVLALQHAAAKRDAILRQLDGEPRSLIRYELVESLELAPAPISDILAGHSPAPPDPRAPPREMESDGI
jgi:hypothetical protein